MKRLVPVGRHGKGEVCQSKDGAAHDGTGGILMARFQRHTAAGIAILNFFDDCAAFGGKTVVFKSFFHVI